MPGKSLDHPRVTGFFFFRVFVFKIFSTFSVKYHSAKSKRMENYFSSVGWFKRCSFPSEGVIDIPLTFLLFMLSILCSSCDCISEGHGVVVDSATSLPLDSVVAKSYMDKVRDNAYEGEMVTDATGEFTGSTGLTGGVFGCPDLVIEFSKTGYETKAVTNPNDTIRLVKK